MYSKKKNFAIVYGIWEREADDVSNARAKKTREARETHLAGPEGNDGPEGETSLRLELAHLAEGGKHGDGEGASGARLDLDLRHLELAEHNIGEELGLRQPAEPDYTLVLVLGRRLLPESLMYWSWKDLVETVLESPLKRVAYERFLGDNGPEIGANTLVLGRVDLQSSY